MSSLLEEFVNFTETLNRQNIAYAICGGWAMAIHGLPRATVDIDLLILAADLEKVWKTAKSFGYDVEGLPLNFHDGAFPKLTENRKDFSRSTFCSSPNRSKRFGKTVN